MVNRKDAFPSPWEDKFQAYYTLCQNKNESSSKCLRAYTNALSITGFFFSLLIR